MQRALTTVVMIAGAMGTAFCAPVAYTSDIRVHSSSSGTQVWIVDDTGHTGVKASEGLQAALNPAWAPDGSRLAFQAIEAEYADIFICNADGSGLWNLTPGGDTFDTMPAFVGDAETVVYLHGPDRTHLMRVGVDGAEPVQLTDTARFYTQPVPLPDGSGVVFTGLDAVHGTGDIYLVTLDGDVINVTQSPALYSQPAVSPDGTTIAFAFDRREIGGVPRGVATMPLAGGAPSLIADDGYPLASLEWSPDGSRIAYTSASRYNTTWVNVVNADGTDNGRLEFGGYHIISWPSFSPDGSKLAYHGCYAARFTVHVVDLETGEDMDISEKSGGGVRPVYCPVEAGGDDQ